MYFYIKKINKCLNAIALNAIAISFQIYVEYNLIRIKGLKVYQK